MLLEYLRLEIFTSEALVTPFMGISTLPNTTIFGIQTDFICFGTLGFDAASLITGNTHSVMAQIKNDTSTFLIFLIVTFLPF